jgi:DNA-binding transcriptional regulator YbjK
MAEPAVNRDIAPSPGLATTWDAAAAGSVPLPDEGNPERLASLNVLESRNPRSRRFDPGRSERIIAATLDVVAEHGVSGTTYRRVATRADVPLGSVSYHFESMHDLLLKAFRRFVSEHLARLETGLNGTQNLEQAAEAVVRIIHEDAEANPPRHLALAREFQAFALREPSSREISRSWLQSATAVLEHHFDPMTAVLVGLLMEGLTLRECICRDTDHLPPTLETVRRVIPGL